MKAQFFLLWLPKIKDVGAFRLQVDIAVECSPVSELRHRMHCSSLSIPPSLSIPSVLSPQPYVKTKTWELAYFLTPSSPYTGSLWEDNWVDSSSRELTCFLWQLRFKELGFGLCLFKNSFSQTCLEHDTNRRVTQKRSRGLSAQLCFRIIFLVYNLTLDISSHPE